jgi:hypothetical protein
MEETVYVIILRNKFKKTVGYAIVSAKHFERANKRRWYLHKGYAVSSVGLLNRFIMNAKKDDPKVDHKNGNKLDNTESNLRFATNAQNSQNRPKKEGASSKYFGVSKVNKKWECQVGGVVRQNFNKEIHAAYWYDVNAKKMYGPDAKVNGVEKPDDFVEPGIEEKRKKTELPKFVSKVGEKFRVRMTINEERQQIGIYETLEEAEKAIEETLEKIEKIEKEKIDEINNREIIRNQDGFAIVESSNNKGQIIVDDDKYHTLLHLSISINEDGYAMNNNMRISRILMNAKEEDPLVDHINRNRLDNRICNLRFSDHGPNNHNKSKPKNASSQYFGVSYDKNKEKYRAAIAKDKIKYWLGYFKNEENAARAYDKKALELYGTFANLNFPDK